MIHPPILYAEDDENDALLAALAFERAEIRNPLAIVPGGQQAIAYLEGTGQYADRAQHPLPCLVLLDVKMPGRSGLEVLKWVRSQPGLCTLPVLMLTSSNQEGDIQRAYMLGANGYLEKPSKPDEMFVIAKAIKGYWLMLNRSAVGEPFVD
jgi:CheY-like chemotaxis protein